MAYDNVIENVTLNRTLRLEGDDWDNTIVRNVTIRNVDGNGILLRDVENVTFVNVTIVDVTGDGIKLSTRGSTSNVVIRDSEISRIGEDGINAGQRNGAGVDHPGLKIIGNAIDDTGLNGGGEGVRHGIYVQSRDALIEGNRVSNSVDGNGISVRSSATVRDNEVDKSFGSGIAYFADHMGAGGTLRIEDNTVSRSGYGEGRADIDLLSVPKQSYAVETIVVDDNTVRSGPEGFQVGKGYSDIAVSVDGARSSGAPSGAPNSVSGSARDDVMRGTGEADVFVFRPGNGDDVVREFEPGEDTLYFRDFGGIRSVQDLARRANEQGGDIEVDLGGGNSLLLKDTRVSDLSVDDFAFG